MSNFMPYYDRDAKRNDHLADTVAPAPRRVYQTGFEAIQAASQEFAIDWGSQELYREIVEVELGYHDDNQN